MISLPLQTDSRRTGILTALGAFLIWGFSPLYFRAVGTATALEILSHRVVWSLCFTLGLVVLTGQARILLAIFTRPRILATLLLSALLVSINWLAFIWAVNHDLALEASMGYFIFPLVMVVLGRLFLDERLNRNQLLALCLVLLGVVNLLLSLNRLPWVALLLATSMGFYSLVRKTVPVDPLVGLTIECLLLFPVTALYLLSLAHSGELVFGTQGIGFDLLLTASALMTALPLILYTWATRILRLGTVGLLQYLSPSCQFLVAVFLFAEPFNQAQLHTFLLIWIGLVIFTLDSRYRLQRKAGGWKETARNNQGPSPEYKDQGRM